MLQRISIVAVVAVAMLGVATGCGGSKAVPTPPAATAAPTGAPVQVATPTAIVQHSPTSAPVATRAPATPTATATAVATATATAVPSATVAPSTPTPAAPAAAVVTEAPALVVEILEGKAEYKTADSADWRDAFDGTPIQQRWSVRSLAVSAAVLHFPDQSRVRLEPNTELTIELFEFIDGGPPKGERHARIVVVDGEIDFDVADAPSPPNTWIFVTTDGAVTIQGTKGSLKRRVSLVTPPGDAAQQGASQPGQEGQSQASVKVEFGLTLLDGAATIARVNPDALAGKPDVEAAVVLPGVEFLSTTQIPVPPDVLQTSRPGSKDAAPPVLIGSGVVDRDRDGQIGAAEFVLSKDIKRAALRAGASLASGPGSSGNQQPPTPPPGLDQAAGLLKDLQAVALGGPQAIQELRQGGDLEKARQKALEELEAKSRGAARAIETFGLAERAPDAVREKLEILALGRDQLDPARLAAGDNPAEFIKTVLESVRPDDVSGQKPDLQGVQNRFDRKFDRPAATPIFDENGKIIGVKKPDEVVFDADGKPVGKKLGDLTAVDEKGNQTTGLLPEVFYLADPDGKETLRPTTFFNAFVPKADAGKGETGLQAEAPLHLVTFDPDGNVVPTVFQYDDSGRPVGVMPISKDLRNASGEALRPPEIPVVEYDAKGAVARTKEIPFIARDENGGILEFKLPSPVIRDNDGKPIALADPGKIVKSDAGIAGVEGGRVVPREALVELLRAGGGSGVGGPSGGLSTADLDAIARKAADFASSIGGTAGAPQFFDDGGKAKTIFEFRPQQVFRDQATGEQTGFRPFTELTCISQDCFKQVAGKEELLNKLEEKVEIFALTPEGKPVVTEMQGRVLFTSDGSLAGFAPPPVALGTPEGASGFAAGDIKLFAAAAGAPGITGQTPGLSGQPGRPDTPPGGGFGFGLQVSQGSEIKLVPRGREGAEITIDPSKVLGQLPSDRSAAPITIAPSSSSDPLLELLRPTARTGAGDAAGTAGPDPFRVITGASFAAAFGGNVKDAVNPGGDLFKEIAGARKSQGEVAKQLREAVAAFIQEAVKSGAVDPSQGFKPRQGGAEGGSGVPVPGQTGAAQIPPGSAERGSAPPFVSAGFPAGGAGGLPFDPSQIFGGQVPDSLKELAEKIQRGGQKGEPAGGGSASDPSGIIGAIIGGGPGPAGQFPAGAQGGQFPGGAQGGQFPGGAQASQFPGGGDQKQPPADGQRGQAPIGGQQGLPPGGDKPPTGDQQPGGQQPGGQQPGGQQPGGQQPGGQQPGGQHPGGFVP